jgi:hypothetical protein
MRSQQQVIPADDRDDAIGRVRFTRVGWPKDRKCVRSEGRQYDHRYHHKIVRFDTKNLRARSIGCYDASVGFSDAAEAWVATLSCGGGTYQEAVVSPDADFKTRLSSSARGLCDKAAPWFADHQPKRRNCRAHFRITTALVTTTMAKATLLRPLQSE